MKEKFVVNEHIDVVLEDDGKTHVYIDGKQFIQCMRLVLTIPISDNTDEVTSIDDAAGKYGTVYEGSGLEPHVRNVHVDPIVEFRAHCSNIQAWVENDYDTRLLHSNIAFPLLKELAYAGDAKAIRVASEEITERIKNGSETTRRAILDSCPELLDTARFESLLNAISSHDREFHRSSWERRGKRLKEIGDDNGAVEAYKIALSLEPSLTEYWFDLCFDLQSMGDTQTVIDACRKALAVDIDKELTWRMLLVRFRDLGDQQGFIDTCKKLFSINPVGDNAWLRIRGLWLSFIVDLRDFCGMQSVLDVCRDSIPNLTSDAKSYLLFRLGEALGAKGDLDGAIDAFRKSLDIDPLQKDRKVVWRYLGDALKAIGDERGADEAYIKIGLSPPRLDSLFD